ncbi:hypothetical protein C8Q75DRAFT_330456 [Abortiporus biennis]|nr:hypothetical protein C8Q75DRAFT_330456 [Abortiporus biennis]
MYLSRFLALALAAVFFTSANATHSVTRNHSRRSLTKRGSPVPRGLYDNDYVKRDLIGDVVDIGGVVSGVGQGLQDVGNAIDPTSSSTSLVPASSTDPATSATATPTSTSSSSDSSSSGSASTSNVSSPSPSSNNPDPTDSSSTFASSSADASSTSSSIDSTSTDASSSTSADTTTSANTDSATSTSADTSSTPHQQHRHPIPLRHPHRLTPPLPARMEEFWALFLPLSVPFLIPLRRQLQMFHPRHLLQLVIRTQTCLRLPLLQLLIPTLPLPPRQMELVKLIVVHPLLRLRLTIPLLLVRPQMLQRVMAVV